MGLRRVKNESMLTAAAMRVASALNSATRRGGKIRVQPTAISRRRVGSPRGSNRVAAGRPRKQATHKRTPKRIHNLSVNVDLNVPHAKSHGCGH